MILYWNTSKEDATLIEKIAEIAVQRGFYQTKLNAIMDLTALQANGTPLQLADMLEAADSLDFAHDLCGIRVHLDRDSGKLKDCFVPRFAVRQ